MGHPIYPILVAFPIGLLTTSVIFDVVHLITGGAMWAEISFWMIAVGVIGGLLAAVFGLIDWLAIPSGTRAKAIGLGHGLRNVLMGAFFAVRWLLRSGDPNDPAVLPTVLSFLGVADQGEPSPPGEGKDGFPRRGLLEGRFSVRVDGERPESCRIQDARVLQETLPEARFLGGLIPWWG